MKWEVTKLTPYRMPGPGTSVIDGYKAQVTTDSGHVDEVFVPQSAMTPEGVTKAVNDHLSKVAAVLNLKGGQ